MTLSNHILLDKNKNYETWLLNASIAYCNPIVLNRHLGFTCETASHNMQIPNGIFSLNELIVIFVILLKSLTTNGLFYCECLDSTSQVALYCNIFENTQVILYQIITISDYIGIGSNKE